jgi:hypothetical protein
MQLQILQNLKLDKLINMKSPKILLLTILLVSGQLLLGQSKNPWEKWNYLIGEWVGEHTGKPGSGDGKFSFQKDLDGKILVRKSRTVFPASTSSAELIHDDLMIIYLGGGDNAQEAIYFDNEGHTIKYKVSFTDKTIILTSDIIANTPRFRYTYTAIDEKTVNGSFEMASPQAPDEFKMYLEGKAYKVK